MFSRNLILLYYADRAFRFGLSRRAAITKSQVGVENFIQSIYFFLDNMKDGVIAKLCCQAEELYSELLKLFQKENLKVLWEREWIPLVSTHNPLTKNIINSSNIPNCR